MFPLLFIALFFGVGLAAYELSSDTHTWVDDHVLAIRAAFAAHRAADAHMQTAANAAHAGDLPTAVQHVAEASEANKAAAQRTAAAAGTAQTPQQRQDAAKSADQVAARQQLIAAAMAHLGLGQCGVRTYAPLSAQGRDALLAKLHAAGMTVTGDDPWDIDTQQLGVKLRAVWDPHTQALKLIVTSGPTAFCHLIWDRVDPILMGVVGT